MVIRVTLGDGTEADCLQKIYPVARWVAAGFSGSVQIGFALIDSLSRWGNAIEEPYAMVPAVLAREWPFANGLFAFGCLQHGSRSAELSWDGCR